MTKRIRFWVEACGEHEEVIELADDSTLPEVNDVMQEVIGSHVSAGWDVVKGESPLIEPGPSRVNALPPAERTITPPPRGWKERTYYAADVSFSASNPSHRAVVYSGFLVEGGQPGGYSSVWNASYDGSKPLSALHYLSVVRELDVGDE